MWHSHSSGQLSPGSIQCVTRLCHRVTSLNRKNSQLQRFVRCRFAAGHKINLRSVDFIAKLCDRSIKLQLLLGNQDFEVAPANVARQSDASLSQVSLCGSHFVHGDALGQSQLAGRDKLLREKQTIVAGRFCSPDCIAFIANGRIWIQTGLNSFASCLFHASGGLANYRTVFHTHLLHRRQCEWNRIRSRAFMHFGWHNVGEQCVRERTTVFNGLCRIHGWKDQRSRVGPG